MRKLNKSQIEEIIKGAQTGASLSQLSSKFGFSKTTIYYHVKEFCRRMGRFDEKRLSEWEKGYLVGFFVGDGCLTFRPKYYSYITKFVLNAKTEKAIANFLIGILSKAGTKPWTTIEENRLNVRVSSKSLHKFLKKYSGYDLEEGKLRKRLLLSEITKKELAFGILAGLIDSDGHARRCWSNSFSVTIWTVSKVLAVSIAQLAEGLGIKTSIIREQHSGFGSLNSCFIVRVWTSYVRRNAHRLQSLKLQQVLNEISLTKIGGPIAQR